MELDQEKFDTVKELATLGVEVANAKANLETLKKNIEEFYHEREGEARNRVHTVLMNAHLLLTETTQYHDEFKGFLASTRDIQEKVRDMVVSLSALRDETKKSGEDFERFTTQSVKEIDSERKNLAIARESLAREADFLNTQRKIINEEKAKITDERGTLQRAKERLNL